MKEYQKPIVHVNEGLAEGVYTASGTNVGGDNGVKCDSIYMKGKWQKQSTDQVVWDTINTYKACFGCQGCRAYTDNGCGLDTHYVDSNYADSYHDDDGIRKPTWEKKGYGPDDPVTDYDCGGW